MIARQRGDALVEMRIIRTIEVAKVRRRADQEAPELRSPIDLRRGELAEDPLNPRRDLALAERSGHHLAWRSALRQYASIADERRSSANEGSRLMASTRTLSCPWARICATRLPR